MIPDYQTLMLPVLKEAADQEISTRDVIERLVDKYELSHEDREGAFTKWKTANFRQQGTLGKELSETSRSSTLHEEGFLCGHRRRT